MIALAYTVDAGIEGIVEALEGEVFCESPLLSLDAEQLAICHLAITQFMPPAIKAIMGELEYGSGTVCKHFFNVCE